MNEKFLSAIFEELDPECLVKMLSDGEINPEEMINVSAASLIGYLMHAPYLDDSAKRKLEQVWAVYQDVWLSGCLAIERRIHGSS